ncbi:hypothetical protein HJ01_00991 [Flavobacterium frigoris PS1]|uniref:Uncharacterized protein n=1 Tax=Flavobacterium frigoris (strain PS1) TaxID=1086011 RepID=H7FP93_FLAFP|nr:hypothetical protein HJ01_00991 [Flavobacterium frigoris PS1]
MLIQIERAAPLERLFLRHNKSLNKNISAKYNIIALLALNLKSSISQKTNWLNIQINQKNQSC